MDTVQILKKSLGLVWRYRALWLFGTLLAVTASNALLLGFNWGDEDIGARNQIIFPNSSTLHFMGQGLTIDFRSPGAPIVHVEGLEPGWYRDLSADADLSDVWVLLISTGVLLLICILLAILFRYTSQAALIRMVDENEHTAKMVRVGRGLRLGWSRVAGKLFLIDLWIALSLILIFGVLFFLAISPLYLLGFESTAENTFRIVGVSLLTVAGLSLFGALVFATAIVLSITQPVMRRACAVDGLGVAASIRQGLSLLKNRFDRVMITWLVWIGIRFAWTIACIPALIILSPVIFFTMLAGIVIGAVPVLLVAGIANMFVNTLYAWIIGALFGLPLFILVTFSPIIFLSGLIEVFKSSFWTLSYREFRPLARIAPQPVNKLEPVEFQVAHAA